MGSGQIVDVLARVCVDDLDAALPLYRSLAGDVEAHRLGFGDVLLARVGPFLLIQGGDDAVRSRVATLLVRDVDSVAEQIAGSGGALLDGPAPGPNGARLVARHPDGTVWEYIEQN